MVSRDVGRAGDRRLGEPFRSAEIGLVEEPVPQGLVVPTPGAPEPSPGAGAVSGCPPVLVVDGEQAVPSASVASTERVRQETRFRVNIERPFENRLGFVRKGSNRRATPTSTQPPVS